MDTSQQRYMGSPMKPWPMGFWNITMHSLRPKSKPKPKPRAVSVRDDRRFSFRKPFLRHSHLYNLIFSLDFNVGSGHFRPTTTIGVKTTRLRHWLADGCKDLVSVPAGPSFPRGNWRSCLGFNRIDSFCHSSDSVMITMASSPEQSPVISILTIRLVDFRFKA